MERKIACLNGEMTGQGEIYRNTDLKTGTVADSSSKLAVLTLPPGTYLIGYYGRVHVAGTSNAYDLALYAHNSLLGVSVTPVQISQSTEVSLITGTGGSIDYYGVGIWAVKLKITN